MSLFDRFFSRRDEEQTQPLELEKGDLPAILIAAAITFGPLIIVISLIYVAIAYLFF